jgi:transcriptional regulator with XRE-family HTH domain
MARKKQRLNQHPIVATFAACLREHRHRRGLSQKALAQRAHVALSYVARLEAGHISPGLDMVARLAETLAVTPEDLIAGHGTEVDAMALVKDQLSDHVKRLLRRGDQPSLQALATIAAHVENSLARRRK